MICLQVLEVRNMDEPMDIDYLSQGYFVNQNINLDFLFIYHQQIFLDIVQNTTVVYVYSIYFINSYLKDSGFISEFT